MKNILIYYDNFCGENSKGGTEVASWRIAKALKETGDFNIFHAYRNKSSVTDSPCYEDAIKLSKDRRKFIRELAEYLRTHEVDAVINMGRFFRHNLLVEACDKSDRDIKKIFMHHFAPGSEIKKGSFKSGIHLLKLNPLNPLYWLRSSFYPLFKLPKNLRYRKAYSSVYRLSDKVVLLSEGYIKSYNEFAGLQDTSKFVAIPNILELSDSDLTSKGSESGVEEKQKRVLILSRMDEIQKRLSLALAIWRKIEDDPDLFDWHLDIVGSGHNTDIVRRLIRKQKLERVACHGWQPRESFLRGSSILLMTSEYEGLPLTIPEAQSFGTVPIAFNSFESLKDIITEYETGVIVEKFGDIKDFVKKLTELMYDESYRKELAKIGRRTLSKFSSREIAQKWSQILI